MEPKLDKMNSLQRRADYLFNLMPRLKRHIEERLPAPRCLVESRLTLSQMHILQNLLRQGPKTMSDMAKLGQVAMPTMTEAVNRLVRMQIVERIRDVHDRRIVRIRITARGKQKYKACWLQAQRRFVGILQTLNAADQRRMLQALKTLETIFSQTRKTEPRR